MKFCVAALLIWPLVGTAATREDEDANPIQKAVELLVNLQEKIMREGEQCQRQYEEFTQWCKGSSRELHKEHESGKVKKESLEASLAKTNAELDNLAADIQQLSGKIATDESDLKAATLIRTAENSDFMQAEKELSDTIDTLQRAIQVLKKSPSFLQRGDKVPDALVAVAGALAELVTAESIFSAKDKASLAAVLEASESAADGDDDDGEAAMDGDSQVAGGDDIALIGTNQTEGVASKRSKVGGILDTLQSMLEKAEAAQGKTRENEVKAKHSFAMLKLSLETNLKTHTAELDSKKKDAAAAGEQKATAEGDLVLIKKAIVQLKAQLGTTQQECMERATAFSTEVADRKEELNALATAKKAMQQVSALQTPSAPESDADSFLQLRAQVRVRLDDGANSAALDAMQRIRQLAQREKSRALAQLASRIKAAIKIEQSGLVSETADPFRKVKGMIGDMISRLEKQHQAEANEKEFCDREMSKTKGALDKKKDNLDALSTRIDTLKSNSANLKEDVARLSQELGEIKRSQLELRKIRMQEEAEFKTVSQDLNDGVAGIQRALKALRDYYAKGSSLLQTSADDTAEAGAPQTGGASGIIGLLEVAESDFTKNLAEAKSNEEVKKDDYEKITKELKVVQSQKRRDEAHKSGEIKQIEKAISDLTSDQMGVQQELSAIKEYFNKLTPKCSDATPWIDEDRHRRRSNIIKGLKDAAAALA